MDDREFFESEGVVHLGSALGNGYTLCGCAIEGFEDDLPPQKPTNRRTVDCPDCVLIIEACRGVRVYREKTAK